MADFLKSNHWLKSKTIGLFPEFLQQKIIFGQFNSVSPGPSCKSFHRLFMPLVTYVSPKYFSAAAVLRIYAKVFGALPLQAF